MLRKVGFVFIANAANAILGFASMILLTQILSVEEFGKYGYLYAISVIAVTVLDFASGTSFVIHYNKRRMSDAILANYNAFRIASIAVVVALSMILYVVDGNGYSAASKLFLLTLAIATLVSFHFQYYFQGVGAYRDYGIIVVTINAVRLVSLLGLVVMLRGGTPAGLSVVFIVLAAAHAFATAVAFIYAGKKLHRNFSFSFDREFLGTIGFLGLSNILIIIMMRIDVFFIKYYLSYQYVGYYQVVFSLCSVFPLLTGSLTAVLIKDFSHDEEPTSDNLRTFVARQRRLIIPGVLTTVAVVMLSKPIIEFLFGQRYAMSIPLLQVMIIPFSMGVVFTPLESYFYSKRPHFVTIMKFMQMTATIVFSLLFIKTYGLIGAGYSTLLVRLLGWTFLLSSMMVILGKAKPVNNDHATR